MGNRVVVTGGCCCLTHAVVLQVEHFQVLLAALEGDAVADSAWVPVFHDLKDHIFVAMCDPECSELALGVMAKFMFDSALQHEVLKVAINDVGVHGSLAHSSVSRHSHPLL